MGDPVAVLVVPAAGDPGRLTGGGARGARVPVMRPYTHHRKPGVVVWDDRPLAPGWLGGEDALVLWDGGALVPEGWDRARRVLPSTSSHPAAVIAVLLDREVTAHAAALLGDGLRHAGFASRVVLLDRVDGRFVERTGGPDAAR